MIMKSYSNHNNAGDYRVAGINYKNVPARVTFTELTVVTEEHADFRVFESEIGKASVTFAEMLQVGDHAAVTRLADDIIR